MNILAFVTSLRPEIAVLLVFVGVALIALLCGRKSLCDWTKKVIRRMLEEEAEDIRRQQGKFVKDMAGMQSRVDDLENGKDDMARNMKKATGSIAKVAAGLHTLEEGFDARVTGCVQGRMAALEDTQKGSQNDLLRLQYKVEELSGAVSVASDEMKAQAERIAGLRYYLDGVFQRDLEGAMKTFDSTISSVLGEMRDELLSGINRIGQIESAVVNRKDDQIRASERGARQVRQLLGIGEEEAGVQMASAAAAKSTNSVSPVEKRPETKISGDDAERAGRKGESAGALSSKVAAPEDLAAAVVAEVSAVMRAVETPAKSTSTAKPTAEGADTLSQPSAAAPDIPKKSVTRDNIERIVKAGRSKRKCRSRSRQAA